MGINAVIQTRVMKSVAMMSPLAPAPRPPSARGEEGAAPNSLNPAAPGPWGWQDAGGRHKVLPQHCSQLALESRSGDAQTTQGGRPEVSPKGPLCRGPPHPPWPVASADAGTRGWRRSRSSWVSGRWCQRPPERARGHRVPASAAGGEAGSATLRTRHLGPTTPACTAACTAPHVPQLHQLPTGGRGRLRPACTAAGRWKRPCTAQLRLAKRGRQGPPATAMTVDL